jgi:hypothetical protein
MSWTDEELDTVFREAGAHQVFEYQSNYFKDIETQLPVNKVRKIAWYWWTANIFIVGFIAVMVIVNWSPTISSKKTSSQNTQGETIPFSAVNDVKNTEESSKFAKNAQRHLSVNNTSNKNSHKREYSSIPIKSDAGNTDLISIESAIAEHLSDNSVKQKTADITRNTFQSDAASNEIGRLPFQGITSNFNRIGEEINLRALQARFIKNSFYIGFNSGVEQAWSRGDNVPSALNSKFSIEVGYTVPLRKVRFSAGLAFEATKLQNLRILERTKMYGFGSSILENSYQFASIYSVLIPVEWSKAIGRHTIGLGLIGEVNLFTHASHESSVDGIKATDASGLTNVDLINRFGLSPRLSYSLALSEKLQIGLSLQTQLFQPITSNRFIGVPTKMPLSGQLFLKRSLKF